MNFLHVLTDNIQPKTLNGNVYLHSTATGNIIAGAATTTLINLNAKTISLTGITTHSGNITVNGNAFIGANTITNPSFVLTGNVGNISGSNLTFGVAGSNGSYSTTAITGDVVIRSSGANNLLLQTGQGTAAIKIDSSNNANVTTQTAGSNNTTIASTAFVATAIANSKPRVTQVFDNVGGIVQSTINSIPWSSTFTSYGGTLLIQCSTSGYATGQTNCGFNILIDSTIVDTNSLWFNNTLVQTTLPAMFKVYSGLSAGSHTIQIQIATSWLSTDSNSKCNLTVLELF